MIKLAYIILCGISLSAFSQADAELLQNKLNSLHSMSAHFKQIVKVKSRIVSQSSGTMALERPGRFRWQTLEPMTQLMIADGNKLWIYDKDLEQVTVKKQEKGLGGTAALFLSGYDDTVNKEFTVTSNGPKDALNFNLQAKASKANFQRITLRFKKNALVYLGMYDQLGQVTDVELSQEQINPKLRADLFQFKPIKGVDVVEQ